MTDTNLLYFGIMVLVLLIIQCMLLAMLNDKLREGLKDIMRKLK